MAPFFTNLFGRSAASRQQAKTQINRVDRVTRLPMRLAVVAEVEKVLKRSRNKQPVGLLIVDFSNVQSVVESGAVVDNDLLRRLTALLRAQVPLEYVVGHMRDREFAVILCGMGVAEVERLADKIIDAVRKDASVQADKRYIATITGIGYSRRADCSSAELMSLADVALRYALVSGRACHVIVDRLPGSKAA